MIGSSLFTSISGSFDEKMWMYCRYMIQMARFQTEYSKTVIGVPSVEANAYR